MQDIIKRRLRGVHFSYYSSQEIRQLSVKEITNPVAFDNLNRPLENGLYDPSMGVSPYDRLSRCQTCGQEGLECPGHCGHIELLLPVYNPFLVDRLLRLLRSKCTSCHRLRITREKLKNFYVIFTLVKLGYIIEAKEYKQLIESKTYRQYLGDKKTNSTQSSRKHSDSTQVTSSRKPSDTLSQQNQGSDKKNKQQDQGGKQDCWERLNDESIEEILQKKRQILKLMNAKEKKQYYLENGLVNTNNMNAIFEETLKEFWGSVVSSGKCPHCNSKTCSIRKEGSSKFFISAVEGEGIKVAKEVIENDDDESENAEDESLNSEKEMKSKFQKGFLDAENNGENDKKKKQQYLNPIEVREHVRLVWTQDKKLLDLIFGSVIINKKTLEKKSLGYKVVTNGPEMFFLETILVTPNRFRPENKLGDMTFLHGHTVELTKLIQLNQELRNMIVLQRMDDDDPKNKQIKQFLDQTGYYQLKENEEVKKTVQRVVKLSDVMTKWLQVQDSVNTFLDASKAAKAQDKEGTGIRQILEKKEGLFRMKMMGKRVNYAARSVISPDPNLNTNEVGVPLFMAKKLTFPEYVNEYNVKMLREVIIRGPFEHPGAIAIEEKGKRIQLEMLDEAQRTAIAKTLMNNAQDKVVYRHLQTGDVVLFNRQPTLHKPSLMSHIVRVLPKEQTIRQHYANCKSYNADFDGDEMNIHFLQSQLARSEGYNLSLNDRQYISATNGKPLRELMQDSIISSVFMSTRGAFFEKDEYQELLYTATFNLVSSTNKQQKIFISQPALLKPKKLWTGKQLISNIIKIIVQLNGKGHIKGLNMESKAKLSKEELEGNLAEETQVIVRDNELLVGVIDKNQVGSGASYGLMHAFHELYGPKMLGQLFTALAKLFTQYLQWHGFTCGIDDLVVEDSGNSQRNDKLKETHQDAIKAVLEKFQIQENVKDSWNLYNRSDYKYSSSGKYNKHILKRIPEEDYISQQNKIVKELERMTLKDNTMNDQLDMVYKGKLSKGGSNVIKSCLNGLRKPFPQNCFTLMTRSGAKGSMVNHSQVSALLGQQELEGKRVPVMSNGKTLPCFLAYDPNPRAGGFIGDRFFSGLRPAEFYFHCMAGREGLIDTAVKTSRSGYLQRCLMKHLESLKVGYDYTVRDADSSIVQFVYGEDSIDPTKTAYLEQYKFLSDNFSQFSHKYDPFNLKDAMDITSVQKFVKNRKKIPENSGKYSTIQNLYSPGRFLGAVSEKVFGNIKDFIKKEEQKSEIDSILQKNQIKSSKFRMLANVKYLNCLVHPGEAVGVSAAMGIGEPSTQMTLNTFHLAGHGGANLTLGIPRLREILMTASDHISTPIMILQFSNKKISKEKAEKYATSLKKINLQELVKKITVTESKRLLNEDTQTPLPGQLRGKMYQIQIEYEDLDCIQMALGINFRQIEKKIEEVFLPNLLQYIEREKKRDQGSDLKAQVIKKIKENQEYTQDVQEIDKMFDDETPEQTQTLVTKTQVTHTEMETEGEQSKSHVSSTKQTSKKNQTFSHQYLESCQHDLVQEKSEILIKLPLNFKKILMVNIVNKLLCNTIMREIKGINNTVVLKNESGEQNYYIQTEGVNFSILPDLDFIDASKVDSNDIWAIHKQYGVEAARNAIIKEVSAVFSVYGVKNDPRHMSLIADFMTFNGKIRAMNRQCIEENVSPFQKMSFETCVKFLTNAALYNECDFMQTPSSSIVLGQVPEVGTGVFNILHNLQKVKD